MSDPKNKQLNQLYRQIDEYFNEEEVRTLCLDLGVEYESLGGRGKTANVRELVRWVDRHGHLAELLALVKADRPNVPSIIALLPPHHIPYHPNKLFTGRKERLTKLHAALSREEPVAVTQVVYGLGGVGKTQLALAYCYRHMEAYDLIYWLRANDALTLSGEMAELAYRLGLAQPSSSDHAALRQLVLNWLQTTKKRWLLVYDNADEIDPNDLRPFLPKLGSGASLITSRNPNWGGLATTLPLSHFTPSEAAAFLLQQPMMTAAELDAHPQGAAAQLAELDAHPQGAAAAQLAEQLGHLPLALEHARAYVENTGCTLADYATYFDTERQELWADAPAPADYDQKTITTTWQLAFTKVRQTPGAAALLNLCCFLAPDAIPLTLISDTVPTWREGLPEDAEVPQELTQLLALAGSRRRLDKAIAALRRYSLLTRDGDTVSLHRLLQTVARDQMPREMRQAWLEITVSLLKEAWPFDQYDLDSWAESAALLSHLLAVITIANKQNLETPEMADLNGDAGFYLRYTGNVSVARPFYERALSVAEKNFEPDDTNIALHLNNLGQLLQATGEYEAARPFMERALAIDEKALGENHPDVAIDLNNLGQLLQATGAYEAARPFMERAVSILEATIPDHPNTAAGKRNLAALLAEIESQS